MKAGNMVRGQGYGLEAGKTVQPGYGEVWFLPVDGYSGPE
jgi:hypothetical protein